MPGIRRSTASYAHWATSAARRVHSGSSWNFSVPTSSGLCRCRAIRKFAWRWLHRVRLRAGLRKVGRIAIHVATEGPLGHAMRRVCLRGGLPFTTSFHTRFSDYLAERLPVPERWTSEVTWAWLRRFHASGAATLAATPTLASELTTRGFKNVELWPRGVDAELFRPRAQASLNFPRPIFLTVGRLAVEKNLDAFLKLDLPGTKVVVGDGSGAKRAGTEISGGGLYRAASRRGACRNLLSG